MKYTAIIAAVTAILVVLAGCGQNADTAASGQAFGKPQDAAAVKVTAKDLVETPDKYKGKLVAMEGLIGAPGCSDCGGVIVADKTYRVAVEPEHSNEFKLPVKTGAKIKVWGVVAAGEGLGDADVQIKARGATIQ